jgi:hypothetical protein
MTTRGLGANITCPLSDSCLFAGLIHRLMTVRLEGEITPGGGSTRALKLVYSQSQGELGARIWQIAGMMMATNSFTRCSSTLPEK